VATVNQRLFNSVFIPALIIKFPSIYYLNEFCQFIKIKVLQRAKAEKQNISNMFKRVWIKTEQYKCFVARATITTIGWGMGGAGANRHQTVWMAKNVKILLSLVSQYSNSGPNQLWIILEASLNFLKKRSYFMIFS